MPMPKPESGQSQVDWNEACMADDTMIAEYENTDQRFAVCQSIWDESKMITPNQKLITAISGRSIRGGKFGYGIARADRYVKRAVEELGLVNRYNAIAQGIDNEKAIKDAEQHLTWCEDGDIEKSASPGSFKDLLPKGKKAPPNTLMVLRYTLTTNRKDRDGDVLHPEGAEIDMKGPLLWQHLIHLPIGVLIDVTQHDKQAVKEVAALLDLNELTEDAAKLIEAGALRFSHGFQALEWDELKPESKDDEPDETTVPLGFEVFKYEVMERSLVSVPSNSDAMMEMHSRGKLASEPFQKQAAELLESEPVQVQGMTLEDSEPDVPEEKEPEECRVLEKLAEAATELEDEKSTKAGRVLSQRNMDALAECVEDLKALEELELPRKATALLERIVRRLADIIDSAKPIEATEEKTAEKTLVCTIEETITEPTLSSYLGEADTPTLEKLRDIVHAMLEANDRERLAAEYRTLVS